MYAVIKTGGKQYKVAAADLLEVEKLAGAAGDSVAFGEVLMVGGDEGVTLGSPLVAGAQVAGEIVDQVRTAKILVFKKRRRQNSKRSHGHRQEHTLVRITEILTDGKEPSKEAAAAAMPKPKKVKAPVAAEAAPADMDAGSRRGEAGQEGTRQDAEVRRGGRVRTEIMAHKKAGGSSRNGRDSAGQRLGVKKFGGESVLAGNILIRQRGTKWRAGNGVGVGKDHTIFALYDGTVAFRTKASGRTYVSVNPMATTKE